MPLDRVTVGRLHRAISPIGGAQARPSSVRPRAARLNRRPAWKLRLVGYCSNQHGEDGIVIIGSEAISLIRPSMAAVKGLGITLSSSMRESRSMANNMHTASSVSVWPDSSACNIIAFARHVTGILALYYGHTGYQTPHGADVGAHVAEVLAELLLYVLL